MSSIRTIIISFSLVMTTVLTMTQRNATEIFDDDDDNTTTTTTMTTTLDREANDWGWNAQKHLELEERRLYKMGVILDGNEPGKRISNFGKPNKLIANLTTMGYVALAATKKLAEKYPESFGRTSSFAIEARLDEIDCPLIGTPLCPSITRRYRTADGTCNNPGRPWRGASNLPCKRFLAPFYEDGVQSIRLSVTGRNLPSPREITAKIHRDADLESSATTLMLMQWGQFVDHDITSSPKSLSFNGSTPRCCGRGGTDFLPPDLTHPNCLPIAVPSTDYFYSRFGIRCLEFVRSAPSTRLNCDLGWREQINQVTSYLDGSTVYGSDPITADSMRTFRNGKLRYGRIEPDEGGEEICRSGALTSDCFQSGDGRVDEQPGLTAIHTTFLRYHNRLATLLKRTNTHWSDEKLYQETRRIVGAIIQHITYNEFLPVVLGKEVMKLFGLNLDNKGYYRGYDERVDATMANAFGTAAFRFGHSLVQNSYIRTDSQHRPLTNNVSLHEELDNLANILSFGAVDRLLLGFTNQPAQKRDEFIVDELTNHLFQPPNLPFGLDLASINIQRGRDHGIPPYTTWRDPCGLGPIKNWTDLERVINRNTARKFRALYEHVDDIDLYSGGLAEKPVRGGVVGPTFACIIAQQFLDLRKGDRFWYENGGFKSSFTPDQLQEIRKITLAQILCQSMTDIETLQPFVMLSPDVFGNRRLTCDDPRLDRFDLTPWFEDSTREPRKTKTKKKDETRYNDNYTQRPATRRPTKNPLTYNDDDTDVTYLFGYVPDRTTPAASQIPIEVNIKIQYFLPTTPKPTQRPSFYGDYSNTNYRPFRPYNRPKLTTTTTIPIDYEDETYVPYNTYRPIPTYNRDESDDLPKRPTFGLNPVKKVTDDKINDKLDFDLGFDNERKSNDDRKFVKLSSVKGVAEMRKLDDQNDTLILP